MGYESIVDAVDGAWEIFLTTGDYDDFIYFTELVDKLKIELEERELNG